MSTSCVCNFLIIFYCLELVSIHRIKKLFFGCPNNVLHADVILRKLQLSLSLSFYSFGTKKSQRLAVVIVVDMRYYNIKIHPSKK